MRQTYTVGKINRAACSTVHSPLRVRAVLCVSVCSRWGCRAVSCRFSRLRASVRECTELTEKRQSKGACVRACFLYVCVCPTGGLQVVWWPRRRHSQGSHQSAVHDERRPLRSLGWSSVLIECVCVCVCGWLLCVQAQRIQCQQLRSDRKSGSRQRNDWPERRISVWIVQQVRLTLGLDFWPDYTNSIRISARWQFICSRQCMT